VWAYILMVMIMIVIITSNYVMIVMDKFWF